VIINTELETLLNVEYLFLEVNKEDEKYRKFLPTIMMKLYENGFFSEEFIREWVSGEGLKDIDKAFMYNQERDEEFRKIVANFIEWATGEEEEEEEEAEAVEAK
jgi:hypothetical protein